MPRLSSKFRVPWKTVVPSNLWWWQYCC